MQFQSQNDRRSRRLLSLLPFGASLLGGGIGLALGRQADVLFNIDAGIVGLLVGAVVGSLLPFTRSAHPVIRLLAAGVGVALPILFLVGSARVTPAVFWGMMILVMVCSAIINALISLIPRVDQASLSRR
jgi:peptidoglycan/LPS O-acetylase OafA/YrhL